MQIDFNNLRIQLARAFNELSAALDEYQNTVNFFHASDFRTIADKMGNLQSYIGGLLCVYEKDNPRLKDVSENISLRSFELKENEE